MGQADHLAHTGFGGGVFVDAQQFSFLAQVRRSWRDIRAECLALAEDSFEPWVQRHMYGQGWSVDGGTNASPGAVTRSGGLVG